ncbi:MAG: di-trans,poly-cis-decaprenylcistransferase, partial [Clostridia bacterium]|nr:di-trans,poly-cis-decaprenylcistransferase [Clostridia bacterium]
ISVVEKQTSKNDGLLLNIALAYGGRLEIVQAVKKIATLVKSGKLLPKDITEELISKYVYTSHVDDPELIIRTGGEIRTSNFLMWQSAYSEYYFTDVLWPEFSPEDLDKAIYTYQTKDRRFGGLNK